MLIRPGSALFTNRSQVVTASNMLFAHPSLVHQGGQAFAAFLQEGFPTQALAVGRAATVVGTKLHEDEIMAGRRRLAQLIYGFGPEWPRLAEGFERWEGQVDSRSVRHSLFPPAGTNGRGEVRKIFLDLAPRWQRAFQFLSPEWQERVRVSALGHRVSPEGELIVDTFTSHPNTFFPLMGRLLFHLLLRHDGTPFPFKEIEPARWQLVGVTLDLMKRVLDSGESSYERGIDPFFEGVASYGETPFGRALSLVKGEVSANIARLGNMLIRLRKGEFFRYLPITPLVFGEELLRNYSVYFATRPGWMAPFSQPDLDEEERSILVAEGIGGYLRGQFFYLTEAVVTRPLYSPSGDVRQFLERLGDLPFEMPFQKSFEEVFWGESGYLRRWQPENLEGTSLQGFLRELWAFLELLWREMQTSPFFRNWISSYVGTRPRIDYEALILEFAKEFVGAFHMIILGTRNPATPLSQMLWEAEAIFMVYSKSSLFGKKDVFEAHVRETAGGRSPGEMMESMRKLVASSARPSTPPARTP